MRQNARELHSGWNCSDNSLRYLALNALSLISLAERLEQTVRRIDEDVLDSRAYREAQEFVLSQLQPTA
jgi:hypothetical protein